jgi:hypothetical protein
MTPQERKMIEELFARLASLEDAPRDEDAVNAINEGLDRAPNALYPLVQSVLVQDEALKRADMRIRELEAELGIEADQPRRQTSFLDGMREKLTGQREGSVPSVRPGEAGARHDPWAAARDRLQTGGGHQQPGYPPGGYVQQPEAGGGSFLGTAAATAAGVLGGALLMNSFRGMFGGGQQGQAQGQANRALDQGGGGQPWNPGAGGDGDLARQAGIEDVGRGDRTSAFDDASGAAQRTAAYDGTGGAQGAGQFDLAQNDADDSEYGDDDDGGFDGGDSDTA